MSYSGHRRQAFTLVELLVVIAIIGVLVALLLPAIQAARESARRSQCINNFKQIGLAMQNYHDTNRELPVGARSCCWGTWQLSALPFLEQSNLFNLYHQADLKNNGFDPVYRYDEQINAPVTRTSIATLVCPSDEPTPDPRGFAKHNYVGNFGNTTHYGANPYQGVTFGGAPFYGSENPKSPPVTKFREITDGLSNTLIFSETVQGKGTDLRGFTWWGWAAGFETFMAPNSTEPDAMQLSGYCDKTQLENPPCIPATTTSPMMSTARSRHPGGVQVSFCDASCRFISDDIELVAWRGISTTRGDEINAAF
jgi:prepilin-type N-terminal cleavage/methylation domain-containing protein